MYRKPTVQHFKTPVNAYNLRMEIFLKREKFSPPTATFSFSKKWVSELKNYISYAHEKGKAEGKAEGILQTAKIMKSKGVSKETIMEYTGLSAEEVEGL